MARPRQRLRAVDHQPAPRRRFYIQPETKPVARTVRSAHNPWHEGMTEAKRSGARLSRGECLYPARHTTERMQDVCSDWRMQEKERQARKANDEMKVWYRKWGYL